MASTNPHPATERQRRPKVAILALQGAFAEHELMFRSLGADTVLIRNLQDFNAEVAEPFAAPDRQPIGLVIPGGESTAMMRIMRDELLVQPIQSLVRQGLPAFGTCAGLIVLDRQHLGLMDILARRNAYGRQLGSFNAVAEVAGIGAFPMTFIRAPYICEAGSAVTPLALVDGKTVAARQKNLLVTAFHPELTDDTRLHELFLSMVTAKTC